MSNKIQKEYNRLCNLKQNQGKTEPELAKLYTDAQINVAKRQVKADEKFLDTKEQASALKLFEHYVGTYEFEAFTDLCTLNTLIYEEILLMRVQNHINELYKAKKDTYLSKSDREALHSIEDRILELKVKLGIDRDGKTKDDLSALQLLTKRFDKYINANKHEFTIACGECGKLLLLRKRVKDFDCIVHPHFSGRFWYNKEAMQLVKDGILSKAQYAKIFVTSVDYVNWCLENEDRIT